MKKNLSSHRSKNIFRGTLIAMLAVGAGACNLPEEQEQPSKNGQSTAVSPGPTTDPTAAPSPGPVEGPMESIQEDLAAWLRESCQEARTGLDISDFQETALECSCRSGLFTTRSGRGVCAPVSFSETYGIEIIQPDQQGGLMYSTLSTQLLTDGSSPFDNEALDQLHRWNRIKSKIGSVNGFGYAFDHPAEFEFGRLQKALEPINAEVDTIDRIALFRASRSPTQKALLIYEPELELLPLALGTLPLRYNPRDYTTDFARLWSRFTMLQEDWGYPVDSGFRSAAIEAYEKLRLDRDSEFYSKKQFKIDRFDKDLTKSGDRGTFAAWSDIQLTFSGYSATYKKTFLHGTPESRLLIVRGVSRPQDAVVLQLNSLETVSLIHVFEKSASGTIHYTMDRYGRPLGQVEHNEGFSLKSEIPGILR